MTKVELTWDILVGKFDGDIIVSLPDWHICHLTGTVLVILAVDRGLGWAVDGKGQTAFSGSLHIHCEHSLAVCNTILKTWSIGLHAVCITAGGGSHFERALRDGDIFVCAINGVGTCNRNKTE